MLIEAFNMAHTYNAKDIHDSFNKGKPNLRIPRVKKFNNNYED